MSYAYSIHPHQTDPFTVRLNSCLHCPRPGLKHDAQVYIGLASSSLLLALAVSFIHRSRRSPHDLGADTSGVLQIAWLLGSEPQLTAVEQPALNTLRVAGMYEVDPGAIRRTKLSRRHR